MQGSVGVGQPWGSELKHGVLSPWDMDIHTQGAGSGDNPANSSADAFTQTWKSHSSAQILKEPVKMPPQLPVTF